ncbi:MAG: hypothetical protein ACD_79C00676G0001 [uncultured bacterium]|nr:MAG: hypothetical protein ACD_79C00676G0001 [uncultured bacterium]
MNPRAVVEITNGIKITNPAKRKRKIFKLFTYPNARKIGIDKKMNAQLESLHTSINFMNKTIPKDTGCTIRNSVSVEANIEEIEIKHELIINIRNRMKKYRKNILSIKIGPITGKEIRKVNALRKKAVPITI